MTVKQVTSSFVIPSAQLHLLNTDQGAGQEIEMGVRNQTNEDETEDVVIHWQEKLFSEKEFDHYGDVNNCTNPLEQKYHEDINELKR